MSGFRELRKNNRIEVQELLELFSSDVEQLDYQEKVPFVNVPDELFNQWEDCYILPIDQDWHKTAYSQEEHTALKEFNAKLEEVSSQTPQSLPALEEFITTEEWKKLKSAALIAIQAFAKA